MPKLDFQGNVFPDAYQKQAYVSYAVIFIFCLVLVVLALLIDLFILLLPLTVALVTVIVMIWEIPKYQRQYRVDEHAVYVQSPRGTVLKKIELTDIRYIKDPFSLPYGKYFSIFSKNSKENPHAQVKQELWFACKDVICLPYTEALFEELRRRFPNEPVSSPSVKTEFEGDIIERPYQKSGRLAAVILDTVVFMLCLIGFLGNVWVGLFVSVLFIPFCIYIHIKQYNLQTRYRIDENGIFMLSKSGKPCKHIPLQKLSVLLKTDLRERPKPRGVSLWGGTFFIFIPKGAEEELALHDATDEWLSVKNAICIPFSQEIADFIYQKTGIVMMMPK